MGHPVLLLRRCWTEREGEEGVTAGYLAKNPPPSRPNERPNLNRRREAKEQLGKTHQSPGVLHAFLAEAATSSLKLEL